ncbi:hypothetical protein BH09ACT10_BH09ACT10_24510 [soil metagenome]
MVISSIVAKTEVNLQVYEHGERSQDTVLLVHGWPDNHAVWDGVAAELAADFHVVTYDMRGTGASSAPAHRSGYRMRRLVDDLVAVLDHVSPGSEGVHLVGHDWGSVQVWGALVSGDPRLAGRVRSFTSLSGPDLGMFGRFLKSGLQPGRRRAVLRQLRHSWYVLAFQVPRLPEWIVSRFGARVMRRINASEGLSGDAHRGPSFVRDAVNGLNLYRENDLRYDLRATDVPVLLLVALQDSYVAPEVLVEASACASDLTRVEIEASHWAIVKEPALVAAHIRSFARRH